MFNGVHAAEFTIFGAAVSKGILIFLILAAAAAFYFFWIER